MLVLTQGQTAEKIIVTLNEFRTLTTGYYLFVFEHITTRDIVNKIFAFADDESTYPDRYNKFEVNTSVLFSIYSHGEWTYKIYEQANGTNTNTTGLTLLEYGILKLNPSADFSFSKYNPVTTFKQYNG